MLRYLHSVRSEVRNPDWEAALECDCKYMSIVDGAKKADRLVGADALINASIVTTPKLQRAECILPSVLFGPRAHHTL